LRWKAGIGLRVGLLVLAGPRVLVCLCGNDDDVIEDNNDGNSDGELTRMMTTAKITINQCDGNGHRRTMQLKTVPWAPMAAVAAVVDDNGDGG
jgi:hypothetical protein